MTTDSVVQIYNTVGAFFDVVGLGEKKSCRKKFHYWHGKNFSGKKTI
jgi:hypothetical protein